MRVRTFFTMKQVKSTVKTETEWQTKYWTIVSDLPPLIRNKIARWPVFHRPDRCFTANLAEVGKGWYFKNQWPKPVF